MPLPDTLFIQEIGGTLFVNKTLDGAGNLPKRKPDGHIGVYTLAKEVRITQAVTVEDVPKAEVAAAAPQN